MSRHGAPVDSDELAIRQALTRSDYFRRSPASLGGPGGHKEWLHFCVYGPEIDILVNFSLCDDVRANAEQDTEFARITVLVRETKWQGDVDLYPANEVVVHSGRIRATFGSNELHFEDGEYKLVVSLRDRPITLRLNLRPVTVPSVANNIRLDPGPPINWLVVPRLCASGTVTVDGRRHELSNAPAYHDHNWGHFAWGRDFAWEWGFGLPFDPAVPWTFVFVRLSNRAHTRSLMQAVFLWKGSRQHRVMRGSDVTVRHEDYLRPSQLFKIPRAMALVAPDLLPDIPRQLHVHGGGDGDRVDCLFEARDAAQVIVPNDHDLGVTIINEVSGDVRISGEVRGETVSMEGRAIFEFLGA
jgi:hypothetical protein